MATKRSLLDFGAHGNQVWENMGPAGKRRKVREYFTARGKPDDYQFTPEEAREATNYIKAVDRIKSGDSWGSGGSSFLQGASSYDDMYKYKDPILGMEPDSVTLEDDEIDRLSDLKLADSQELGGDLSDIGNRGESIDETPVLWDSEIQDYLDQENDMLGGDLHDIGNRGRRIDETPSLLDYDEDLEAFDSNPVSEKSWWEELTESGGESKELSPMQKYGAKLITDIFGEKEERPQQSIGASPLTPGRSLDMSKYSTSRPKKERYRNMGLLGRA